MEALLSHKDNLEFLHLDFAEAARTSSYHPGPRERLYMGVELRQMHKLKRLILGSQNICGLLANGTVYDYTMNASVQAPRVVECIPEYLEYLEIHSCGRNIINQLEEFLDTLANPGRIPNLKSVKFTFNKKWVKEEEMKGLATSRDGLVLEIIRCR
ncbi:hypothetical protein FBULB1_8559 [Fusarium bulbicola]|nr:hypothetical protein FBULB1_8559 [Fusarium bulbicola]